LEEGMATYFSKIITERETKDYEFCAIMFGKSPNYLKAYMLYLLEILMNQTTRFRRKLTTNSGAN
jgi:hypothetical protein